MDRGRAKRIETAVDRVAAALFGAAAGYAALQLPGPLPASGAPGASFGLGLLVLGRVSAGDDGFDVPEFAAATYSAPELEELLLTDADRLESPVEADQPLLLDDLLGEIAPDC